MRSETYKLDCPPTGSGAAFPVGNFVDRWIQVVGLGASGATLAVEITIDGTDWVAASGLGALAADGVHEVVESADLLRLRVVSGNATGTVATFVGRNTRAA